MIIIGCDYHPGFQQIAFVDTETGDYGEQRLARIIREDIASASHWCEVGCKSR